jgi:hypothetical protein
LNMLKKKLVQVGSLSVFNNVRNLGCLNHTVELNGVGVRLPDSGDHFRQNKLA